MSTSKCVCSKCNGVVPEGAAIETNVISAVELRRRRLAAREQLDIKAATNNAQLVLEFIGKTLDSCANNIEPDNYIRFYFTCSSADKECCLVMLDPVVDLDYMVWANLTTIVTTLSKLGYEISSQFDTKGVPRCSLRIGW